MYKEQALAYCVMETTSDPISPKNIKEVKDPIGLYSIKFDASLQSYNRRNRNGRNYDKDAMWESLQANHIQELIRKNSWCGEAGHPITEDVKRILTIDPKLISHRINNIAMNGYILNGTIETMASGYGIDMTKFILQRLESAFSLRALAQINKTPNGEQLVKTKSHVVCFDWVILPSHPEAYQDTSKSVQVMNRAVTESGNNILTGDKLISIMESQIIDFISEESCNINLVSNVFEVAKESMNISKDLKCVIMKESKGTFYVRVEDKIKKDIMNYMNKI